MTAPIAYAAAGPTGRPTWDIGTGALRIVNANCHDTLGREWTVDRHPDGEKGWAPPAGPRTQREDRPEGHGAYRGPNWRKARIVTLSGKVWCPTTMLREQTELELAGLCSDEGRLYAYRRTTEAYDHAIAVELDDDPLISVVSPFLLAWSFQFAAPDPRKHDYAWQEPVWNPFVVSTGGLDDSGGGLTDAGGGLDDAAGIGGPLPLQLMNSGTAPAYPFITLTGQIPQPRILHVETGAVFTYAVDIAPGEVITVNCDPFAARGVPAHSCLSSVRGDVSALWTIEPDWPVIAPRSPATFVLASSGAPGSQIKVGTRSAWW
jgi:hypothetical protein